MKNFLKKLIHEVESKNGDMLDQLYEKYAYYMVSLKDDILTKGGIRVCKHISYLFPEGCYKLDSCPSSRKLTVQLQCSLNMLEGDTGCSVWPSSLFLSEFILSFPDIFCHKSCFEVGSGVGLVGICLAHVKASKVILSDGDHLTLTNMKLNLEMNKMSGETNLPGKAIEDQNKVKCIYLPWESATENELQNFMPDIILGADVIYDPSCLPHLVRVLATLLNETNSCSEDWKETCKGPLVDVKCSDNEINGANQSKDRPICDPATNCGHTRGRIAYIASVIRNIDTFNYFLELAEQANLSVIDITGKLRPFSFLPYMKSYDPSTIRLYTVSYK